MTITNGWTDTEASIVLRRGAGGTVRVEGTLCTAPLWFRWDGETLWLVGSGASPAGEDHIRVRVEVAPGVAVRVRSVAATVVYAARGAGTHWHTDISVADGARLDWRPEPVIVTGRARHDALTVVRASAAATVTLDEVVVLGRAGEEPGGFRSTIEVHVDGAPVLLTSVDTAVPGWVGPGGVDGARVIANRVHLGDAVTAGPSPQAVRLEPAAGCHLAVATAENVVDARDSLDAVLPA